MTQTEIFYDLIQRNYSQFFDTKEHKDIQDEYDLGLLTDHEYKVRCVADAMFLYRMKLDDRANELLRKPQTNF